jgi:hypothetical protein
MNIAIGRRLAAIAFVAVAAQPAVADDDLWLGVRAGTQGLGLEATWRPVPYLDLRVGGSRYNYDTTRDDTGIEYNLDIDLSSFYATANLRVPLSPFRVTAGIVSNGNEGRFLSLDSGSYTIGDVTYPAAEVGSLSGKASFDSFAPYAGVGLDFRVFDTFGLHFDTGVMYQGAANVSIAASGPIAGDPTFQQNLELERQALEDELDDYKLYPVIAASFSFNF